MLSFHRKLTSEQPNAIFLKKLEIDCLVSNHIVFSKIEN